MALTVFILSLYFNLKVKGPLGYLKMFLFHPFGKFATGSDGNRGQRCLAGDITNVRSLTIGIEGAGWGIVYVDDIRLYKTIDL